MFTKWNSTTKQCKCDSIMNNGTAIAGFMSDFLYSITCSFKLASEKRAWTSQSLTNCHWFWTFLFLQQKSVHCHMSPQTSLMYNSVPVLIGTEECYIFVCLSSCPIISFFPLLPLTMPSSLTFPSSPSLYIWMCTQLYTDITIFMLLLSIPWKLAKWRVTFIFYFLSPILVPRCYCCQTFIVYYVLATSWWIVVVDERVSSVLKWIFKDFLLFMKVKT